MLVNNGGGYGYRAAVEEGDEADVRRLFDTNLFGTVAMIKAVLPGVPARLRVLLGDEGGVGAVTSALRKETGPPVASRSPGPAVERARKARDAARAVGYCRAASSARWRSELVRWSTGNGGNVMYSRTN